MSLSGGFDLTTLAHWPVPVWSKGGVVGNVAIDKCQYVFADMKGAVVALDLTGNELSLLHSLKDSVSSDTVVFNNTACFVSHAGDVARVKLSDAALPQVILDSALPTKSRAAVQTHTHQGRAIFQLTAADGTLYFRYVDDGAVCPVNIAISSAPKNFSYGVVASPLFFTHKNNDYLFYVDRAERALCASLTENSVVWSMPLPYGVDSDPVFDTASGTVLFSSGESLLGGITGNLYAYDAATATLRWEVPLGGGADAAPALVTWQGIHAVATATLKNASVIIVSLADGRILYEYGLPETGGCRHSGGACVPIGYSGYHTQTTVCKIYAQPIACVRTDGSSALLVFSHNGNAYWLTPDQEAVILPLGGSVRASAAMLSDTALVIHAGSTIARLTLPEGWRIVAQPTQKIDFPTTQLKWRFAAENNHLRCKRLRRKFRRRFLSDRDS